MSMVIANDSPRSGQVPLLKHAIMQWMQEQHKTSRGRIHGDTYTVAEATKASVTNVHRALWDLQKQGLVTFRERKGEGSNGHGGTTVLVHFQLTQRGQQWTSDRALIADFGKDIDADDLNPGMVRELDAEQTAREVRNDGAHARADTIVSAMRKAHNDMPPPQCTCGHKEGTVLKNVDHLRGCPWAAAMETRVAATQLAAKAIVNGMPTEDIVENVEAIMAETRGPLVLDGLTPANALAALLRYVNRGMNIRDANLRLGYARDSTAIYSLVRLNPGAFAIEKGSVSFTGPRDWTAPIKDKAGRTLAPNHGGRRRVDTLAERLVQVTADTPLMREAKASVALDGETQVVGGDKLTDFVASMKPKLGPEITGLLSREAKRAKVAEAVAALEAAGLDDDALLVMTRIPDDNALESEVLALVRALGYAP